MKPPDGYRDWGPHDWKYGATLYQKKLDEDLYLDLWRYPEVPARKVPEQWEAEACIQESAVGTVNLKFLDPEGNIPEIEEMVRRVARLLRGDDAPSV